MPAGMIFPQEAGTVPDAAGIMERDFKKFTGINDSINLSGGLAITDERVAFYKTAEIAEGEEKGQECRKKSRLSLFGYALSWEEISGGEYRG